MSFRNMLKNKNLITIVMGVMFVTFFFTTCTENVFAQNAPGGITTNLELWLRGNSGVINSSFVNATNGDFVNTWEDQTTNGFNYEVVAVSPGAIDPTWIESAINFNPAIQFSEFSTGTGTHLYYNGAAPTPLELSGSQAGGVVSVNTVFQDNGSTISDGRIFAQDVGSLAVRGYWLTNDGSTNDVLFQVGPSTTTSSTNTLDIPMILRRTVEFTPTDRISGYTNGLQETTINSTTAPVSSETLIGKDVSGFIPEIAVYDSLLSESDGQKVDTYFAIKYGVTLDPTDTSGTLNEGEYVLSSGDIAWPYYATGYHNDITVIARDDSALLDQRISQSVNSDSFIRIATSSDFTSPNNSSTRNAFSSDQNFFTIGNDNGSIATWNNTGNVPTDYYRIDREWRMIESAGLGTINIQIDIDDSDADLPTFANGSYYILVDTDQDSDYTDETPIALSHDTAGLWRGAINFPSTTNFTIAARVAPQSNSNNGNPPTRRRLPELMVSNPDVCDIYFTKFMHRGDAYDPEITKVQNFLNHHMGVNMQEDSIFGYQTEAQVKDFQTHYSLKVDGIVGPETLSKLNEVYCLYKYKQIFSDPTYGLHGKVQPSTQSPYDIKPILMYGVVSDEVKVLQERLNSLGFYVARFGMPGSIGYEYTGFGRSTESAVRRFQKSQGLTTDGIVNDATRNLLGI